MHPTIGYHLSQHHLADLRHQAQRATMARDARRARPHQGGHPSPGFARRALGVLSPATTQQPQ
jgi:hypothetical protein